MKSTQVTRSIDNDAPVNRSFDEALAELRVRALQASGSMCAATCAANAAAWAVVAYGHDVEHCDGPINRRPTACSA